MFYRAVDAHDVRAIQRKRRKFDGPLSTIIVGTVFRNAITFEFSIKSTYSFIAFSAFPPNIRKGVTVGPGIGVALWLFPWKSCRNFPMRDLELSYTSNIARKSRGLRRSINQHVVMFGGVDQAFAFCASRITPVRKPGRELTRMSEANARRNSGSGSSVRYAST